MLDVYQGVGPIPNGLPSHIAPTVIYSGYVNYFFTGKRGVIQDRLVPTECYVWRGAFCPPDQEFLENVHYDGLIEDGPFDRQLPTTRVAGISGISVPFAIPVAEANSQIRIQNPNGVADSVYGFPC